jgi:hypothetical protein
MNTEFKKFLELKELDKRNFYFGYQGENGFQNITLEEFYEQIANIKLDKIVPEKIVTQFDIAKNLSVYSCFVYRFHQPAKMQAYSTVELALKDIFGVEGKSKSFKKMIKKSIELKLINDIDFKGYGNANDVCKRILEFMPRFRNIMAHGDSGLVNNSPMELMTCRDFINQLYKNKGLIK